MGGGIGNPNNIGKNMLTIEQTIELAKIIASRMAMATLRLG